MAPETQNSIPDPRDNKRYYFEVTPFRHVVTVILKFVFKSFTIFQASGLENLPAHGPAVLASNHMSVYDMFPIQFILPRPLFYMAKEELHKNPVLDPIIRQLGSFPVKRGARDIWALNHAKDVLDNDQVLGMFPEGSRSKRGLRTGKTGAARLAISGDCPIVPVALEGTQAMFSGFPHRKIVKIHLGEPIYPEPGDTALALTDRLMFTIAEMLPTELRGVYAERPPGF